MYVAWASQTSKNCPFQKNSEFSEFQNSEIVPIKEHIHAHTHMSVYPCLLYQIQFSNNHSTHFAFFFNQQTFGHLISFVNSFMDKLEDFSKSKYLQLLKRIGKV